MNPNDDISNTCVSTTVCNRTYRWVTPECLCTYRWVTTECSCTHVNHILHNVSYRFVFSAIEQTQAVGFCLSNTRSRLWEFAYPIHGVGCGEFAKSVLESIMTMKTLKYDTVTDSLAIAIVISWTDFLTHSIVIQYSLHCSVTSVQYHCHALPIYCCVYFHKTVESLTQTCSVNLRVTIPYKFKGAASALNAIKRTRH